MKLGPDGMLPGREGDLFYVGTRLVRLSGKEGCTINSEDDRRARDRAVTSHEGTGAGDGGLTHLRKREGEGGVPREGMKCRDIRVGRACGRVDQMRSGEDRTDLVGAGVAPPIANGDGLCKPAVDVDLHRVLWRGAGVPPGDLDRIPVPALGRGEGYAEGGGGGLPAGFPPPLVCGPGGLGKVLGALLVGGGVDPVTSRNPGDRGHPLCVRREALMHLLSQGLPFVDDGCMLTLVAPDLDLEPLYVIKPLRVVEQGR